MCGNGESDASTMATQSQRIQEHKESLLRELPKLHEMSIYEINRIAVRYSTGKDHVAACAAYELLFDKVKRQHVTHQDLHTCYSNSASEHLMLEDFTTALDRSQSCIDIMRKVVAVRCATGAAG